MFKYSILVIVNIFMDYSPPVFYPVNLHTSSCVHVHVFAIRVKNGVDPDQMASSGSTVFSKRKNPNSA